MHKLIIPATALMLSGCASIQRCDQYPWGTCERDAGGEIDRQTTLTLGHGTAIINHTGQPNDKCDKDHPKGEVKK